MKGESREAQGTRWASQHPKLSNSPQRLQQVNGSKQVSDVQEGFDMTGAWIKKTAEKKKLEPMGHDAKRKEDEGQAPHRKMSFQEWVWCSKSISKSVSCVLSGLAPDAFPSVARKEKLDHNILSNLSCRLQKNWVFNPWDCRTRAVESPCRDQVCASPLDKKKKKKKK